MPEKSSWPADEAADAAPVGVIQLAASALTAPVPPPDAEQDSREQVLAQFQEGALPSSTLHPLAPTPADSSLTDRVGRALRRFLGR